MQQNPDEHCPDEYFEYLQLKKQCDRTAEDFSELIETLPDEQVRELLKTTIQALEDVSDRIDEAMAEGLLQGITLEEINITP